MEEEAALRASIGQSLRSQDDAAESAIKALWATLDRKGKPPSKGEPIPQGWHSVFFWPNFRPQELRPDGSPISTGVLPKVSLPRRVFGGVTLRFHQPILIGEHLTRETLLKDIQMKEGKAGAICIATLQSKISTDAGLAVEEFWTTVFRDEDKGQSRPAAPLEKSPQPDAAWSRQVTPDPVLLMRYSALTFNSHRIHFDREYAIQHEKYAGLVVHGPLMSNLMLDFAADNNPGRLFSSYSMRAQAPVYDTGPFRIEGCPTKDGCSIWISTDNASPAMTAEVTF